jgi:hypothetical protein
VTAGRRTAVGGDRAAPGPDESAARPAPRPRAPATPCTRLAHARSGIGETTSWVPPASWPCCCSAAPAGRS